jgi:hypothetical protein
VSVALGRRLTPSVEHPAKEKPERDLQRPHGGRERRWEWWQWWHLASFLASGAYQGASRVFLFQPDQPSGDMLSMTRTCPYLRDHRFRGHSRILARACQSFLWPSIHARAWSPRLLEMARSMASALSARPGRLQRRTAGRRRRDRALTRSRRPGGRCTPRRLSARPRRCGRARRRRPRSRRRGASSHLAERARA